MNSLGDHLQEAIDDQRRLHRHVGKILGDLVAAKVIEMVKVDGETKFRIPAPTIEAGAAETRS